MSVKIIGIEKGSPASSHGIMEDEILISINGNEIIDVLDYRFYQINSNISIVIESDDGERRTVKLRKGEYEEIGLKFDTYLMDKQRSCKNNCIFCFIDQLPEGMRETLYFKDDDSRLSFLFGNYITLTNLSEREINRIINMKISPMNISVHTTNPELRKKMMNNRFAGDTLQILNRFSEAGIKINCQIVSCVGINDGDELKRTLNDLEKLGDCVESIAVVPVGITKFRNGLFNLKSYDKSTAENVIRVIEEFGDACLKKHGVRKAYPADEFYLKAERAIPNAEFYEEFAQIENGVGMITSLKSEFYDAIEGFNAEKLDRKITIACGVAAKETIEGLANSAQAKFAGLRITVIAIKNKFFGENINVSGLIVGKDFISQLKGKDIGEEVLISSDMLRKEGDIFLDDVTIEQAEKELMVKITAVNNNGYELLKGMKGSD